MTLPLAILEVVVLPTCYASLRVQPKTGATVASYSVTFQRTGVMPVPAAVVVTGVSYIEHDNAHYLARVDAVLTKDGAYTAVVSDGTNTSAAVAFTVDSGASRAQTIRQRVCDLITDAELTLEASGDENVDTLKDLFARPETLGVNQQVGIQTGAVVEIRPATTVNDIREMSSTRLATYNLPIRLLVPARGQSTGADALQRAHELVCGVLTASDDLGLAGFGVVPGSIEISQLGDAAASGTMVEASFSVKVAMRYSG